jgi:hypothetical protein
MSAATVDGQAAAGAGIDEHATNGVSNGTDGQGDASSGDGNHFQQAVAAWRSMLYGNIVKDHY